MMPEPPQAGAISSATTLQDEADVQIPADTVERINDNPLYEALGIRVHEVRDGRARATLTPTVQAGWPTPGQPHGGVLFTTIDTTMAWAVISLGGQGSGCATVDCSIQYPAPASHGPFVCQAAAIHRTGRTAFVRAEITDSRGAIVAMGQGTFRIIAAKSI